MGKIIFLPGIDGSKTIFREFYDIFRLHSTDVVSYPHIITTEWMKSLLSNHVSVILIGYSFGGVVARKLAQLFPNHVKAIVIIDSAIEKKGIYHPLKGIIPFLTIMPVSILHKSYQYMLYFKLRRQNVGHHIARTYTNNISDIVQIFDRHNILPNIWVESIDVPFLWIDTTLGTEETKVTSKGGKFQTYKVKRTSLLKNAEPIIHDIEHWITEHI